MVPLDGFLRVEGQAPWSAGSASDELTPGARATELPAGQPPVTRHSTAEPERRCQPCRGTAPRADAATSRPAEGVEPSLQSLALLSQARLGLICLPRYKQAPLCAQRGLPASKDWLRVPGPGGPWGASPVLTFSEPRQGVEIWEVASRAPVQGPRLCACGVSALPPAPTVPWPPSGAGWGRTHRTGPSSALSL